MKMRSLPSNRCEQDKIEKGANTYLSELLERTISRRSHNLGPQP